MEDDPNLRPPDPDEGHWVPIVIGIILLLFLWQ